MKKRFFLLFVMFGLLVTLASCAASNKYVKLTLSSDYYEVYKGQTIEIVPAVNKGSKVGEVTIEYSAYDESVATYADGKLQGVEYGETIIKVVYAGNATICDVAKVVVVEHDLASEVGVDETPVEFYETDTYDIPYISALEAIYTFESSNTDVATVDANGKVTAALDGALHNDGKAEIIVTASDLYGAVEDVVFTVEVTVKEAHYAISYDLAGGSFAGAYAEEYDVHALPHTLDVPTREGYTFAGWKLNGEGEAVYAIPAGTEGAVSYTAQWTPNKYALNYDLVGGTNAAENPVEHEYDAEIVLKAPTKVGYTFIGWEAADVEFVLVDEEAQTYSFLSKVAADLELTAKWSENTYYVTYVTNGATTNENSESFKYSEGLTLVNAVKVGHTFAGWYTTEDFQAGSEITGVLPNCADPADLTVYAKFNINQYTITFVSAGSAVAPITLDYDSVVTAPADPTREGYTFAGWDQEIPARMPASDSTITATWTENTYNVTYVLNGATTNANPDSFKYSEGLALVAAVKVGHTFAGWYTTEDFQAGTEFVDIAPNSYAGEGVTVYAKFTVNQYTITFVSAGSAVAPITQDYDTPVTAPANPTREGYVFAAWDQEIPARMPASDTTITATWTENIYNVTYVLNGATTNPNPDSFKYSEGLALVAAVKVGHTFAGWYTTEDFQAGTEFVDIAGNSYAGEGVTVYAKFTINQYTITFVSAGSAVAPITQDYDSAVTAPANPTREGYTFAGWDQEVPARMPGADTTITATWTENTYNVTYVLNGATTNPNPDTFKYSEGLALVPAVKIGHTFAGWYTTEDFQAGTEFVAIAGNSYAGEGVTVYAKFTINQYTITFVTNGDTPNTVITQDFDSDVTAPADPSKVGHTFKGWDQFVPTRMPGNDLTITAVWEINKYTIKFDVDGGSEIADMVVEYGASVTAPADPTKEGYTFAGWVAALPATMPAENLEVKATWTINTYTITFVTNGDTPNTVLTQDYNTPIVAPAAPEKVGHTFKGWDKFIPATMPAEDVIINGVWEINTYTITFDVDGGSEVAAITLEYGAAITAPADPTKVGHTFAGWDLAIPATMPAENKTITATWTVNAYTITFVTNSETPNTVLTQDYNTTIVVPGEPTKLGYEFTGWDQAVPATMPAENLTITATWSINSYTITFNTAGGSEVAAITLEYGAAITAPADPTKVGHTFAGWDVVIPATMPAENKTITATWTVNTYSITFVNENGTPNTVLVYDYNATVTAPGEPTKSYYEFAGWDQAVPATMPAENLTITATWTPVVYNITYVGVPTTATNANPATYTVESEDIALVDLVAEHYDFLGWFADSALTVAFAGIPAGSNGDVTVYCSVAATKYAISYQLPKNAYFYTQGNTTPNVSEYEHADEVVLETPTLPGHTFVGWYNNAECTGEAIAKIEVGSSGTQTFYPKFEEVTYSITFVVAPVAGLPTSAEGEMKDIAGLEAPAPVEFTITSPAITFAELEAEGYEFVGWFFLHEGQLVKLVGNFLPSNQYGNISFYALWK